MDATKMMDSGAPTRWTGRAAGLVSLAALAAAYLVVRSKTMQVERENPPAGKFVDVGGVRLHYVEQGQGAALVLLHGNATMAEDFRLSGLYGQLARNFRVIAFDRPGFGYSERPRGTIWTPQAQAKLLGQALQRLGAEEYLVLGHSMGTQVALAMALEAPDRVRGLLLLAGYYYPSLRLDVPMAALPAIPLLGDLMRFTVSPLFGRLAWPAAIKQAFSPNRVAASFRRLPAWMSLRPSQLRATAAEAALMVPSALALRKRYPELRMPVAILAGEGDKVVNTEDNSVRLHRELPRSALRLFPQTGHMMQHLVQDDIAEEANRLAGVAGMVAADLAGNAAQAQESRDAAIPAGAPA
ncbi:MAG TPA: alpha/beta hydrolase [Janthinobacterium sp.]|jgi:pimeloyl-ACP methyl ester carboxylesterase|nr:alpha/beta hydrolase [Janthinobacterium sp.]